MKRRLLASTAFVGANIAATPAVAANGIRLSVGGFFNAAYQATFDDDGEGEPGDDRNTDGFFQSAEIFFDGRVTLDIGLAVGARVELEGETENDQIDEAWIFFSGGLDAERAYTWVDTDPEGFTTAGGVEIDNYDAVELGMGMALTF